MSRHPSPRHVPRRGVKSAMDWQRAIDAYCERVGAAFWAEPVNALTNLAFILAAIVGAAWLRRQERLDLAGVWLVGLVVAVGIGSFLFHTVATLWALLADVIPITLFIVSFLVLTVRRFFRGPWWLALAVGAVFLPSANVLSGGIGRLVGDGLNGSEGYVPALLALVVCGAWLRRRGHPGGTSLLVAAAIFTVSLTFRSIDEAVCDAFPLGTHFMWHLLNGLLLGWLLVSFVRFGQPQSRVSSA